MSAEDVARAFHEAYEGLAPEFGYNTRAASARPWEDVPEANRKLMVATVEKLEADGVIVSGLGMSWWPSWLTRDPLDDGYETYDPLDYDYDGD